MTPIRNSKDLQLAIENLRSQAKNQQAVLKPRFSSFKAITKTAFSLLPPSVSSDWRAWLKPGVRFLPAAVTKLFLKKSSFFVKSLLGLAAQVGSHSI